MKATKTVLHEELATLCSDGHTILLKEVEKQESKAEHKGFVVQIEYQRWYSLACRVMQRVLS